MALAELSLTHLSLFVTSPDDGMPTAGLPVYAEIAVPWLRPPRAPNRRFTDAVYAALNALDPGMPDPVRKPIVAAVLRALAEVLEPASQDALIADYENARNFIYDALKYALAASARDRLATIPAADLDRVLETGVRAAANNMGLAVFEPADTANIVYAEPLGLLTTDHVGYVSYDLRRLKEETRLALALAVAARKADSNAARTVAIHVHAYGQPGPVEVFSQARFANEAIVGRLSVPPVTVPSRLLNLGGQALQAPSLTDWRLSPASFAASPRALLGEDGCEQLLPSSLSLQEFVLRQVVRVTDPPAGYQIPAGFQFAYVDEYKVSWYALGHSLGEIRYSLPLAPGEQVKLAVIDWSWDSLTKRDETTRLDENLLHQTHRERQISEVVKSGLQELQKGSSFMTGMANSLGASAAGKLGGFDVGAVAGNTFAIGGSTATSEGSRDLAAENVQRINDSFSQASAAQRELTSTVVIQARQEEKQNIQTRIFANYNRSHTLTILYYEVLRHYRVTVEWMRRRPAVLIPRPARVFDDAMIRTYRSLLEPAVFDERAKAGFDALEQLLLYKMDDQINPKSGPPAVTQPRDWTFTSFIITVEVGSEQTSDPVRIEARLANGATIPLLLDGDSNINKDELFNDDGVYPIPLTPQSTVKWGELAGLDLYVAGDDNLDLHNIGVEGWGPNGKVRLRDYVGPTLSFIDANKRQTIGLRGPDPDIPVPPAPPKDRQRLTPEQNAAISRLMEHIDAFNEYYERVVYVARPEDEIAKELATLGWPPASSAFDHVDPTPLQSFGNFVAFPLVRKPTATDDALAVDLAAALNGTDPARRQWAADKIANLPEADQAAMQERIALASAKSERLITLPSRGVFAEGKLGHCNLSEEIDNTRFWRWEEHPLPTEAPGINPVTPVQPTPQQIAATPTPFPQSLINIVSPTPAPDPVGLGAALTLLATPNIFRDMSGRQEVAALLDELIKGSIEIGEAATRASDIRQKYGAQLDKQQKDMDLGVTQAAAQTTQKAIESDAQVEIARQNRAAAEAAKADADAKKAGADAVIRQAEAVTHLPPEMREPVRKEMAANLAGNPTKNKTIVFKAVGFNGQVIDGLFAVHIRDVIGRKDVVNEPLTPASWDWAVSFATAEPRIDAHVERKGDNTIKIDDKPIALPAIRIVNDDEPYQVGKSHKVITVMLRQTPQLVAFKAKTTDGAVQELMDKWGGKLGVNKVVAAEIVAEYQKKNNITHTNEEEKSYSFNLPTEEYKLKITSR